MLRPIRRVVTGFAEDGKSVVIMDSAAPNVVVSPHRPGGRTNVWRTESSPARFVTEDPASAAAKFTLEPPRRGINFRISEYPPEAGDGNAAADYGKAFAEVGAAHRLVEGARHPMMHATETVDFAIVLEGEIWLLLDEEEVHLKTGDVVIQQGTNHAWENRGDRLARMAFILVDAEDARFQQ
jgi:mannose-6-phosphate isomerase-like protein (cupin superfamily)